MKLSVIIPIYNGASFLEKLVDTINAFTFTDFECIFIDNNSTDNSLVTLKELLLKTSLDYLILSEEKQGAGYARNTGIKNAKGEYLAFLDCDDVILPEKFERDMEIFSNHDVDFVFCRAKRFYEDGRIIKHPIKGFNEGENSPPHLGLLWLQNFFLLQGPGSFFVKKRVVESLNGFHSSLTGEDAFLFIRMGLVYKGFFYDKPYYHYFRHNQSTISQSNNQDIGSVRRYFELRQNLYRDPIVQSNEKAMQILKEQLQYDLLKLQQLGGDLKVILKNEIRNDLKLSYLLFNPVSLFINRRVSHIKYNPFFQIERKIFKKRRDRIVMGMKSVGI